MAPEPLALDGLGEEPPGVVTLEVGEQVGVGRRRPQQPEGLEVPTGRQLFVAREQRRRDVAQHVLEGVPVDGAACVDEREHCLPEPGRKRVDVLDPGPDVSTEVLAFLGCVGVRDAVDVDTLAVDRDRGPRQSLRWRGTGEFTAAEVVPLRFGLEVSLVLVGGTGQRVPRQPGTPRVARGRPASASRQSHSPSRVSQHKYTGGRKQ